ILKNTVALYEDSNSDIWIGTYNQGVVRYKRKEDKFKIFDIKKEFVSKVILGRLFLLERIILYDFI
ncbi:MAG: hypothetical protein O6939_12885, partial [Bacteroidetes bacterium]|nr:hypothetical protein [Bacteroidota bacterium]